MSHLFPFAAAGTDLPVKILATIGAFTVGGFLGGWAVGLAAKFAFNQKVPDWLSWIVRLLSGLTVGYLTWMMLAGNYGWGFGNGIGGNGKGKDKGSLADKRDEDGKSGKTPDPVVPPKQKDKDPDPKPKTDGPGIGAGETIRVEVLGNGPLETLAGGGKVDPERRYRIADAPTTLRTFAEIKRLILVRRSQTPPLRKLFVVIYPDSPDQASPPVKGLVDWARDLDPGVVGVLEVQEELPTKGAPLE